MKASLRFGVLLVLIGALGWWAWLASAEEPRIAGGAEDSPFQDAVVDVRAPGPERSASGRAPVRAGEAPPPPTSGATRRSKGW
jgi:hypothetical protein